MKAVQPGHVRNAAKPFGVMAVCNAVIGTVSVLILGTPSGVALVLSGTRRDLEARQETQTAYPLVTDQPASLALVICTP
jgi:hypothetical protein